MKQFFTVMTTAIVFISFYSYTINELRNILQADPPPKDRGQWKTGTFDQYNQEDPPLRDRDHW